MQSQKFELNCDPEMRQLLVPRSSVQRLLTAAIAAIGVVTADATVLSVQAASLTQWSFDPTANQLEITVKDGTTPRYFLMAQPARIVLDLPDTAVGSVSAQQTYAGAVRQIRVSQFEPGLTRIVMEISPGVSLAPGQVKLQKVGNESAQASNSRWVLQPLITKSVSANAVTVKPSVSSLSRPAVTAPAASKPVVRATKPLETKPSIAPSVPSKLTRVETPIAPSQVTVAGSSASSKPAETDIPATSGSPTAESGRDRKPAVVVPDLAAATVPVNSAPTTAAPTQPVAAPTQPAALAPVLPSPPMAEGQTVTPSPPAVTPVDPNVAVDTQRGVAIAVPTPATLSTVSGVPPQPPASSQPASSQPASSQSASSQSASSQSASAQPVARVEPSSVARSRATAKPAATTTAIASRSTTPSIVQPSNALSSVATLPRLAAAEIPTTLAAAPTALAPSVSVPPLNTSAPSGALSPSEAQARKAQVRQSEASFDIPSAGLSGATSTQPSVSVPPPIQVGTPSLGAANGPPSIEAPPISVFAPNVPIEPPVSVPPLQQPSSLQQPDTPTAVPIKPAQASYDANTIRQPTSSANLAPPLNVVPLQTPIQRSATPLPAVTPGYDANTIKQPPSEVSSASIVEFGQPLPAKDSNVRPSQPLTGLTASQGVRQAFKPTAPDVLLPAGTVLNLRYPGDATLLLQTDRPQQEVLVLLTELRDAAGNLLAPAGSAVTGRFETTTSGSQFVTQAIAIAGRTISLTAQSDTLDGSRKVQGNNLAVNSGIGLVAGGVLGAVSGSAGLGAIGGAAAGAAATLITAPKPAAIQPGQVVQVRLTQDLRSFE